jgi:hypothetical protein
MRQTRRRPYGIPRSYRPAPAENQFAVKFVESGLKAWIMPAVANSACDMPYASAEVCNLARRDAEKATDDFRNYVLTAGILGVVAFLQAL